MARTPEQFSVTDDAGNTTFIADDVSGSAAGVVREIILAPGWLPVEQRVGQSWHALRAEKMSHIGRGGRQASWTLTVLRTFSTLAAAVAFRSQHAASIPSLGVIQLTYRFGGVRLVSTGYFEQISCTEALGLRCVFTYTWRGTGFEKP